MGGKLLEKWSIPAATLFSVALVAGAYLLARGEAAPAVAQASTETALLEAIATKDSSGDGLPDWEKSLYGIPLNATTTDYFHLGMTDGEAAAKGLIVPKAVDEVQAATSSPAAVASGVDYAAEGLPSPTTGTLTDTFAKNFFSLYLAAEQANGGGDLSSTDIQNISNEALNTLSTTVAPAPDFKSADELTVTGSGPTALTTFAASAEDIFHKNATNATTSEIAYLQEAVEDGNVGALSYIAAIAKADRDSAVGIAALPVPEELAAGDLELVNALMRLGEIENDFSNVDTDPLTAMLALEQYPQATQALGQAFTDIDNTYAAENVVLAPGTPGAAFANVVRNATEPHE